MNKAYERFRKSLYILATYNDYNSETYPASVDQILFPTVKARKDSQVLLEYFFIINGAIKQQTGEFEWIPWKFQDYINFIRYERSKLFPLYECRQSPRKFISHFGWYRSDLLSKYIYYLDGKRNSLGTLIKDKS